MALIKCPECQLEVSDKAAACPKCGYPIAVDKKVQTIEQTGKKYKGMTLIGFFVAVLGLFSLNFSIDLGLSLILVGVVMMFAGKIGGWWHHS
ncbi:MAG TPA: zinc-ribbon domain-containing protein [Candidatus Omnitrophota bacterium]|nr:zinc-ribbon domain-containing protein [Candidatus Omnitrophota bacterium]